MNNIELITALLIALQKTNAIPSCEFKKNSPLYNDILLMANISNSVHPTEQEKTLITRWMNDISTSYDDIKPNIDSITTALSNKILDGIQTLSNVKKLVKELTIDIEDDINRHISLDPKLDKEINENNVEFTFDVYDFSMLNTLGSKQSIIDHVTNSVLSANTSLSPIAQFNVVKGKYLNTILGIEKLESRLSLDPEIKDNIIDTVNAKDENTTKDMVNHVLTTILDGSKTQRLRNTIERMVRVEVDPNELFFYFASFISDFSNILPLLIKELNENKIDITDISKNIKTIETLMEYGAYYIYYHRDTTFADTILFTNDTKNPDMVKKCEDGAISNKDIAQHKSILVKNIPMSKVGLTLTRVLNNKERVDKLFKKEEQSDKIYTTVTIAKYKKEAIVRVLNNYFKNNGDIVSVDKLIHKANHIVRTNVPITDIVYNTIIDVLHKDSMVEMLYKELGIGYAKLLDESSEVSEIKVAETNMVIYAEIITKFIKKHMLI